MYPVAVILALQKFIGHGFYSINTIKAIVYSLRKIKCKKIEVAKGKRMTTH